MLAHLKLSGIVLLAALASAPVQAFDLQGHRGTRGHAPENTLAAFAKALEIGVTTLETDLAVTKDGILVLSHDPVLNPDIARGANGEWITAPGPVLHQLTFAELRQFDVGRLKPGTKYAAQFAEQKPVDGARVPALAELFELVRRSGKAVRFNLETKLSPSKPDETLAPDAFARLAVEAVRAARLTARVTIQSFDWRALIAARQLAPEIETVCLTSEATLRDRPEGSERRPSPWLAGLDPADHDRSPPRLSKAAGCGAWSPHFGQLSAERVQEARALGLKVLPWTINAREEMARVIDMSVDGLITDYPDRAREVMAAKGITLP
jgi:glycerophosphoryl diester phosphodiesterase